MKFKRELNKTRQDLNKYSKELQPLLENIVASVGFQLFEFSFLRENHINYLRIKITHPGRKVTLSDCEIVSKQIGKEFDQNDPIPFPYTLEVQSPGIDKEFTNESEHMFTLKDLGLVVKS
ncbi:MAG: hypothetical protein HY094_03985 [Candidatus Melainabacteria bacterium]|nr:hypothetical protein [Candidatus Melainabacteria bacterium]